MERAGVKPAEVDEVVMGQVLQAGAGPRPARQASINAGIPVETPAWSLNQLCGSGLRAVALGAQQILQGDAKVVVAGGQESMSQSPHAANLRNGQKMGDLNFVDTMIKDGLWDGFPRLPYGSDGREYRQPLADHPRGPGPLRGGVAEQGRGRPGLRAFRRRNRAGDHQGPQGRHYRR